MDPKAFSSRSHGSVIDGVHDGNPIYLFHPHPLPPDLALTREHTILVEEASRLIGELSGFQGSRQVKPSLLVNLLVRREAVLSSKIEGTITTVSDLYAFEAGQMRLFNDEIEPTSENSAVREVLNYVYALEFGLDQVLSQERHISNQLVREIHQILLRHARGGDKRPGEFRHENVSIGPPGSTIHNATYVPPPPMLMIPAMEQLERYIGLSPRAFPRIVDLALIHYHFEALHPFFDGNGRVGRLLIALLMAHWGLLSQPLLYISGYLEQNRPEYYRLLQAVSEKGAWEEWVTFFINGIIGQARDTLDRIALLVELQQAARLTAQQNSRSNTILQAVDLAFESPYLNSGMLMDRCASIGLEITEQTARNNLQTLVKTGFLQPVIPPFPSRSKWFAATSVLQAMS